MSIYDQLKIVIDGNSESEIRRLKGEYFDRFCVARVRSIATENTNLDTVTNRLIDLMQDTFLDLFDGVKAGTFEYTTFFSTRYKLTDKQTSYFSEKLRPTVKNVTFMGETCMDLFDAHKLNTAKIE